MSEHLHTVTITGDEDSPRIQFVCAGDRTAECHQYPDCRCESWVRGEHEHPFVSHDECWLVSWFDNADQGGVDPMPEGLAEAEIAVGTSGSIATYFNGEYVEWEFINHTAVSDR